MFTFRALSRLSLSTSFLSLVLPRTCCQHYPFSPPSGHFCLTILHFAFGHPGQFPYLFEWANLFESMNGEVFASFSLANSVPSVIGLQDLARPSLHIGLTLVCFFFLMFLRPNFLMIHDSLPGAPVTPSPLHPWTQSSDVDFMIFLPASQLWSCSPVSFPFFFLPLPLLLLFVL